MNSFWKSALKFAGLAAVGAFVFYSLYKDWLTLPIFERLTSEQTFLVMCIFLVLVFLAFFTATIIWFLDQNRNSQANRNTNSFSFSLPEQCTFREAITAIAKCDNSVAEFQGFSQTELNAELTSQDITTTTPQRAILMIRQLVQGRTISKYKVSRNHGIYIIKAK